MKTYRDLIEKGRAQIKELARQKEEYRKEKEKEKKTYHDIAYKITKEHLRIKELNPETLKIEGAYLSQGVISFAIHLFLPECLEVVVDATIRKDRQQRNGDWTIWQRNRDWTIVGSTNAKLQFYDSLELALANACTGEQDGND